MAYAPCDIKTTIGGNEVELRVRTDYPFTDTIDIILVSKDPVDFPLDLRIPAWAEGATVDVDGAEPVATRAGTLHRVSRRWSGTNTVRLRLPLTLRAERRLNESVTIHRGPLVFALQIGQDWRKLRDQSPTADWEVHPTTPWNYALAIDPANPAASFHTQFTAVAEEPFSSTSPALRLIGKGRRIDGWELVKNAAASPPESPLRSSRPIEEVVLIPYASAKLRITELPLLGKD